MADYRAFREDGTQVHVLDEIVSFRDETWIFGGIVHSRKIWTYRDKDPKGPTSYPNRISQEFYPSVFNLHIIDVDDKYADSDTQE